ncbi:hypothetical protein [Clostridium botulinum]|nr:hypothetical protein [Clostridium botulinum]
MCNKYFSMTNINTKDDNKVIMDLINNLINQGCIINEMNII